MLFLPRTVKSWFVNMSKSLWVLQTWQPGIYWWCHPQKKSWRCSIDTAWATFGHRDSTQRDFIGIWPRFLVNNCWHFKWNKAHLEVKVQTNIMRVHKVRSIQCQWSSSKFCPLMMSRVRVLVVWFLALGETAVHAHRYWLNCLRSLEQYILPQSVALPISNADCFQKTTLKASPYRPVYLSLLGT